MWCRDTDTGCSPHESLLNLFIQTRQTMSLSSNGSNGCCNSSMALTQLSPELDGSRLLEPKLNAPYNNLYGPRRIALDQDNRIHVESPLIKTINNISLLVIIKSLYTCTSIIHYVHTQVAHTPTHSRQNSSLRTLLCNSHRRCATAMAN